MDILIKILQFILSFSLLVIIHEFGHFLVRAAVQDARRKILPVFQPVVLAFQVQKGGHRIRYRLDSVRRLRENRRDDRRVDGHRPDETARPTVRVPAKPAWQRLLIMVGGVLMNILARRIHLHRNELYVGKDLPRQQGRQIRLRLQRSGPGNGFPQRR